MATFGDAVKGITDLRVTTVTGDTPGGTHTDIVGVKGLSVQVSSDSDQQTGDDSAIVMPNRPKVVERFRARSKGEPSLSTSCSMRS